MDARQRIRMERGDTTAFIYSSGVRRALSIPPLIVCCFLASTPPIICERQTAGLDIVRGREISAMGVVVVAGVLSLLGVVWSASRMLDRRSRMAETLETKVVGWYIATGEVNALYM